MAWFEFHQSLVTHRKLYALAGKLGISRPTAAGHLAFLWAWALDNAPDGDLTNITPHVIKLAADWPKKADVFLEACIESGFIDRDNGVTTCTTLHDWDDYAGKLRDRRERNKEAMRLTRAQHVTPRVKLQNSTVENSTQPTTPTPKPPDVVVLDHPSGESKERPDIFALYEGMGWTVNQSVVDTLANMEAEYDAEWLRSAFQMGAEARARNVKYMQAILKHWAEHGRDCECQKPQPKAGANGAAPSGDVHPRGVQSGAGLVVKSDMQLAEERRQRGRA